MRYRIYATLFQIILLNCNSTIETITSKIIPIPFPNDSTIAFITDSKELGLHVATYYIHEEIVFHLSRGTFDTDVCWSTDKKNIYYTKINRVENKFQIWKMRFDGSNKQAITPSHISCTAPQVSLDGQYLVFTAKIGGLSQIIITDTTGGNWNQLTNIDAIPHINKAVFYLPGWVPDNQHILFTYHHYLPDQYMPPHLGMINRYTKEITCFNEVDTLYPHHAQWSPTREEIIFVGNTFPGDQIYRMNADQTNLIKLTTSSCIADFPDWSSDGERIVFHQTEEDESEAIWKINRDGSNKKRLISQNNQIYSTPCW